MNHDLWKTKLVDEDGWIFMEDMGVKLYLEIWHGALSPYPVWHILFLLYYSSYIKAFFFIYIVKITVDVHPHAKNINILLIFSNLDFLVRRQDLNQDEIQTIWVALWN